jgi:hypothetical protein
MKHIKGFKIFESVKIESLELDTIYDLSKFVDYFSYLKSGLLRGNAYEDFKLWCLAQAYLVILIKRFPDFYKELVDNPEIKKEMESKIKVPFGYDGSKDYGKEVTDKGIQDFIESLSKSIESDARSVKNLSDSKFLRIFDETLVKSITPFLTNVFYPGYMSKVVNLKFLDYFPENMSDYISGIVTHVMKGSVESYSKLEKDPAAIGKKFISLLKEISKHDLNFFKNVVFPDNFNSAIIEYFKISPDSFKVADEIKKSNTNIYNQIKSLLPNLDTAADLGDLGF